MNEGWIKISRGIERHWLWNDGNRLKWWIYLLLHAQWEDSKVLCGNQLVQLQRGQLLDSVNNLSAIWGCCRKTATQFLDTLQYEDMIAINRGYNGKSVITICNYESYQDIGNSIGYNACYNSDYNEGNNAGSNTTKEKEKNQKNKENSKEIKKEEKTLKKEFFQGDDFSQLKKIWSDYYYEQTGTRYFWAAGRDNNALKSLADKLSAFLKPQDDKGEAIKHLLECFLNRIDDKWILNNLSLANVNMKYNEIISKIRKNARQCQAKQDGKGHVDFRPYKQIK